MKKEINAKFKMKDSYFDGYEYKGYQVRTKLAIEGQNEYKPLKSSNPNDFYNAFKNLKVKRQAEILFNPDRRKKTR